MPNFVDDDTNLQFPKVDRRAIPPGETADKFIRAADWNEVCQAAYDLRSAVQDLQGGDPDGIIAKLNVTVGTEPAALAATPTETEDWNPWGEGTRTTLVRVVTATAGSILKSLDGGTTGDIVILENHGDGSGSYNNGTLKIRHNKTGTAGITAGNNIYCPNLQDIIIPYTGSVVLYYDNPQIGWITIAQASGSRYERLVFHEVSVANPLVPTTLAAGDTDNYNPTTGGAFNEGQKTASYLRLAGHSTGSRLTGLVPHYNSSPTQCPIKIIQNVGGPLTLVHAGTNSSAAYRFDLPGGKDITLLTGQSVIIAWDPLAAGSLAESRWRLFGSSGGSHATLTLNRDITPSTLAATVNDWNPTDWKNATCWRVTPGPTSLTGMTELEPGAIRILTSFGAGLTIAHQSSSSSSRNRFYNPGAANFTLNAGDSATFRYDSTFGAWFCIGWTK